MHHYTEHFFSLACMTRYLNSEAILLFLSALPKYGISKQESSSVDLS